MSYLSASFHVAGKRATEGRSDADIR